MKIAVRKFWLVLAICGLFQTINAKQCEEQIDFKFDDRQWEKGYEASTAEGSIVEYTLKGENVHNWTELVSVQSVPLAAVSMDDYYTYFMDGIKKAAQPADAQSRIINKTKDSIFFEWWIAANSPLAQHEWFRLFKTPASFMIIRYTTKKLDDVNKAKPIWEKILNDATVKEINCK